MRRLVIFLWLLCLLTPACAPSDGADLEPARHPIGKADVAGSCAASDCGGQAEGGNCFCDEACSAYGDCCADREELCGAKGLTFATFNAGLAVGAVPFAEERVQPIIDELARNDADVLCLQEVWLDEHADALQKGLKAEFPYAFREVTRNDSNKWLACGPTQWADVYKLKSCVDTKCKPGGVSLFECVKDPCATEYAAITDTCKLCLAANPSSPLVCAAWKAPLYGYDGRNGLLLLSRKPLEHAGYTPFETALIKRGMIHARVGGFNVQCTHMTADLESVPYPAGARFHSWREEHHAEVAKMVDDAGRQCTVLVGDLNAGPANADEGIGAELPDNFETVLHAGYSDLWKQSPVCTWCGDNPLVCSKPDRCGDAASRIDHVLFHGCPGSVHASYRRFADGPVHVVDEDGQPHEVRASDHAGVMATVN